MHVWLHSGNLDLDDSGCAQVWIQGLVLVQQMEVQHWWKVVLFEPDAQLYHSNLLIERKTY